MALVARSNRVLGEAPTDAQGLATFAAALASGSGNAAPALVLVEGGDDLAVLSLDEAEFDLSDRGVEGRPAPGPIDVFLTTDRVLTRPHCPWQNGKAERFNRTLQEQWAYRHPFTSNQHRHDALAPCLEHDNYTRGHTACGGQPPISRVSPRS